MIPGNQTEQGRFTGTVGTGYKRMLSLPDTKVKAGENCFSAVASMPVDKSDQFLGIDIFFMLIRIGKNCLPVIAGIVGVNSLQNFGSDTVFSQQPIIDPGKMCAPVWNI